MDSEEEWEYISDDGFTNQQPGGNEKGLISRDPNAIIDMNYFVDPLKKVNIDPIRVSISPNPVEFDCPLPESPKPSPPNDWIEKEVVSLENPSVPLKSRDNQFADMKLDSPKSVDSEFIPKIELSVPQMEEKQVEFDGCNEKLEDTDEEDGGSNIWKKGMTGIGALCTFGFAIATICVIALGSRHGREKQQDQELHFQIYTRDKRIKRVVHRAAKLNEAIQAMRGAPVSRAHISIGGYYESL